MTERMLLATSEIWKTIPGAPSYEVSSFGQIRSYVTKGGRRLRHPRSEEHTSELQSQSNLVCRLLLEKKKNNCSTPSYIALSTSSINSHSPARNDPARIPVVSKSRCLHPLSAPILPTYASL